MVGIKDMEIPGRCMNCRLLGKKEMYCPVYPRRYLDIITVATSRPDWCPLVETGTCKDCKHTYCEHHEETCDIDEYNPNFYCADFRKRGNENGV